MGHFILLDVVEMPVVPNPEGTWIAGSTPSLGTARTVGNSDARSLSTW